MATAGDQNGRMWRAGVLRWCAIGYPVAVLVLICALRFVGERWWVTTVGLYLPRWPFAIPLLPLVAAILWLGPMRLLWSQMVAAILLLMLLGLRVALPNTDTPRGFQLRVLTCNINTGSFGIKSVTEAMRASGADVILLQEVDTRDYGQLRMAMSGYEIHESGQFWMASRYPIRSVQEPPHYTQTGIVRSLRFVRYQVDTPGGAVTLYNIHPVSPRDGLNEVRGDGFRQQILRGNLFNSRARSVVLENTRLRLTQLQGLIEDTRRSPGAFILAGDTNLPDLSWAYARWLGSFRDGFAEAGNGFGYTFPAPRIPWMRIDRILADDNFRFRRFRTLDTPISDHRALVADLEWAGARAGAPADSR